MVQLFFLSVQINGFGKYVCPTVQYPAALCNFHSHRYREGCAAPNFVQCKGDKCETTSDSSGASPTRQNRNKHVRHSKWKLINSHTESDKYGTRSEPTRREYARRPHTEHRPQTTHRTHTNTKHRTHTHTHAEHTHTHTENTHTNHKHRTCTHTTQTHRHTDTQTFTHTNTPTHALPWDARRQKNRCAPRNLLDQIQVTSLRRLQRHRANVPPHTRNATHFQRSAWRPCRSRASPPRPPSSPGAGGSRCPTGGPKDCGQPYLGARVSSDTRKLTSQSAIV